jgi:hypothetical protein
MKKFAGWILISVFAALPTLVVAQDTPVKNAKPGGTKAALLSDADLDKVHAGAFTLLILQNPGNASVMGFVKNHLGCINQCGAPTENGATGQLIVITPNQVIDRCVGRCL